MQLLHALMAAYIVTNSLLSLEVPYLLNSFPSNNFLGPVNCCHAVVTQSIGSIFESFLINVIKRKRHVQLLQVALRVFIVFGRNFH